MTPNVAIFLSFLTIHVHWVACISVNNHQYCIVDWKLVSAYQHLVRPTGRQLYMSQCCIG